MGRNSDWRTLSADARGDTNLLLAAARRCEVMAVPKPPAPGSRPLGPAGPGARGDRHPPVGAEYPPYPWARSSDERRPAAGRTPPVPRGGVTEPSGGGSAATAGGGGEGPPAEGGRIVSLPAGGSLEALSCAQPHGDDPHRAATPRTAERLDVRPRPDAPGPGPLGRTGGDVTAGRHGTGRRNGYPIVRLRVPPVPPARVAVPAVGAPQGLPRVREGRGARRRPLARREALAVPRQARGPLRPVDARPGAAVVPHRHQRERGAAEVGRDIPEGPPVCTTMRLPGTAVGAFPAARTRVVRAAAAPWLRFPRRRWSGRPDPRRLVGAVTPSGRWGPGAPPAPPPRSGIGGGVSTFAPSLIGSPTWTRTRDCGISAGRTAIPTMR